MASKFNLTFRYIDDVLSINNDAISNYLHLIYPPELEINETTESHCSASYLDLFLEFDRQGKLSTKIYDKRDDFNFPIVNFPFLSSNIPSSPAYGVFTSQLIRYARASSLYKDFIDRSMLLAKKLLTQGYQMPKLISSLKRLYGRHHVIVDNTMSRFQKCLMIYWAFHNYFSCLLPDFTLKECMTGDTCGAGGAHSSGTPGLTLDDSRVHAFPCFCVFVCRSTLSVSLECRF